MRWMAPELLVLEWDDGPPTRPSKQSDIFSFGGILLQVRLGYYQLLDDIISSAFRSSPIKFPIITCRMMPLLSYAWPVVEASRISFS
jgi:hypothetical protein